MNGPSCTNSQATPQTEAAKVTGLRTLILELVLGSAFATQAEKDRCIINVANCQAPATLAKWYRNAVRELANREEAAPSGAVIYATGEQQKQIICLLNHPAVTRRHKTRVLLGINRLTEAAAALEINRLTAYVANPFGGAAVNARGEMVWASQLTA